MYQLYFYSCVSLSCNVSKFVICVSCLSSALNYDALGLCYSSTLCSAIQARYTATQAKECTVSLFRHARFFMVEWMFEKVNSFTQELRIQLQWIAQRFDRVVAVDWCHNSRDITRQCHSRVPSATSLFWSAFPAQSRAEYCNNICGKVAATVVPIQQDCCRQQRNQRSSDSSASRRAA